MGLLGAYLERSLFQSACAINKLRNKEGTGHGRPWLPSLSLTEATAAIELVGTISGFLLARLDEDNSKTSVYSGK
ncbi:MAG: hypothetical protein DCE87_14545 [Betaproteobacteria bacterium]|nr:MAG: hypothetical protein DCE87_14545 [Betaproteobacteria bacterium]PZO23449.1 MAG: hypothetical protein DCE89_09970 [Betaproteobacteria bacterium]